MNTLTKNQRITKLEAQVSKLQKILSVTDKSLIIDEAELPDTNLERDYFYSNMVHTLLTNGSKYVVVYVSDSSEANAIKYKDIRVIKSVDVRFNATDGTDYMYVVPINNQGEPLTASEVGL